MLAAPSQKIVLLQQRMALDLQGLRPDPGPRRQGLQFGAAEVRHADVARQPLIHQLLHGGPGGGQRHLLQAHLLLWATGKRHAAPLGHWPVDQIQIQPLQAQVRQGAVQGGPHLVGLVAVVPELAGDPQLLALYEPIGEGLPQRLADLGLVAVDGGGIEVAVAQLQGGAHRGGGAFGRQAPGAEAQGGHGVAVGERQGGHGAGHRARHRGRAGGTWER